MNYIKPEQIKEYVSKNPEGIAGMSEELSEMVNHFVVAAVTECMDVFSRDLPEPGDGKMLEVINRVCNVAEHFGVDKEDIDSACPLCGEDGGTTCGMPGCQY